jgi:formyltetrahydrofolate deformylase
VAAVSGFLFEAGGDILDAQQFDDALTGRFFARFEVEFADGDETRVRGGFAAVMAQIDAADWRIRRAGTRPRVLLLASRADHCLVDLLHRWRTGDLAMDVAGIVANHPREAFAQDFGDVPFHYLPVSAANRDAQEAEILRLAEGCELVVLARYMQVLSAGLAAALAGRCVNIHHSFLPGFKGARPYHQAHARGVKLIGATAHFVTDDLDEGPIIEQRTERVSHRDTPEVLMRRGRDIERQVLADAMRMLLDDRVFLNGATTVVFG